MLRSMYLDRWPSILDYNYYLVCVVVLTSCWWKYMELLYRCISKTFIMNPLICTSLTIIICCFSHSSIEVILKICSFFTISYFFKRFWKNHIDFRPLTYPSSAWRIIDWVAYWNTYLVLKAAHGSDSIIASVKLTSQVERRPLRLQVLIWRSRTSSPYREECREYTRLAWECVLDRPEQRISNGTPNIRETLTYVRTRDSVLGFNMQ